MYDAITRDTYAQLFKLAEANLPKPVRDYAVKTASVETPVAQALEVRWGKP